MAAAPGLARKLFFDWAPPLAYMALIWWLSSRRVNVPTEFVPLRDKGLHFLEYASLGVVLSRATLRTWPHIRERAAFAALLATFAWGVLDELHQAFVAGRSADPADLVADGAGAVVGVIVFSALHKRWVAWRAKRSAVEGRRTVE